MKRSLIALAVFGAFAGAASAQSSVTLYGRLDAGYQWNEQATSVQIGAGATAPGTNIVCVPAAGASTCTATRQESKSGIEGGYVAGNRWGLRGSEALGNGISAIFTVESGFDISTGQSTQGGRLFGRQAWVGLSSDYGSLVAGRIATFGSGTGSFDMFGRVDPFGAGWGINTIGSTFISAGATTRADNTVAYVSPTWAGFKFGAAYSFNFSGNEQAPSDKNTTVGALGASFSWGPMYAVVTYDQVGVPTQDSAGRPINANQDDQKHTQFGLTWDFKFVKLYGAYAIQDAISLITPADGTITVPTDIVTANLGNWNNNAWMLGATVPLGKFTLRASYQYSDADNIVRPVNGVNVSFEPDYDVWGLGVDYKLSNRTLVYLGYGNRSADGSLTSELVDRQQFAVGLNHSF